MNFFHIPSILKLPFNLKILETRQAWRAAFVVIVCLIVNHYFFHSDFPGWIIITALICLQGNFGASLRKAKQRVVGTATGCLFTFLVNYFFPHHYTLYIILLLMGVLFSIYHSPRSYTYTIFFLTVAVMMLYTSIFPHGIDFLIFRIEDVALGGVIGAFGVFLLWPEFARKNLKHDIKKMTSKLDAFFLSIIHHMEGKCTPADVYSAKNDFFSRYMIARTRLIEIYYELGKANFPLEECGNFLYSQERIFHSLLTLHNAMVFRYFQEKKEVDLSVICNALNELREVYLKNAEFIPLSPSKANGKKSLVLSIPEIPTLSLQTDGLLFQDENPLSNFESIKIYTLLERISEDLQYMNTTLDLLFRRFQGQ